MDTVMSKRAVPPSQPASVKPASVKPASVKPASPRASAKQAAAKPAPPPAPRGGRARAVSELLPDAGRAAFRRFGFVQSAVVSRWPEIVGSRYAAVSAPESIAAGGVLNLVVRGAHGTMIQHIAPEIVERVNRFFGYEAVGRVQIRQGELPVRARLRTAPPSLKAAPIELGASLRTIADPELRAVLEALAAGVAATSGPPRLGPHLGAARTGIGSDE